MSVLAGGRDVLRPGKAPAYLELLVSWARRHEQDLVFGIFIVLGVYLTVKGAVRLF